MNQREKITVACGALIVVAVLGWRIFRTDGAAVAGDTSSIAGAIAAIRRADTTRSSVVKLTNELAVAIPQLTVAEQEAAIRVDLASKAQSLGIQMLSQKGIKSSARGTSKAVQLVQYRLEMFGQFDAFMKLVAALEKSPIPYVIREVNFESTQRAPGENRPNGQQGGGGGGDGQPGGGGGGPQGGGGGGGRNGGGPQQPPTGKVNVTMRIQSYLFPAEATGARSGAAAAAPANKPDQAAPAPSAPSAARGPQNATPTPERRP